MAFAFDTLAYAETLEAAGFTHEQARAQAEALAGMVADNLATKADIVVLQRDMKEMETTLRREIELVRRDMKEMETTLRREIELVRRDMKEMETTLSREIELVRREIEVMSHKLTIRLGAMLVVAVGVLAAIQKLL